MDVLPAFVVLLAAADNELALLDADVELVADKTGYRKRNTQPLGTVTVARNSLDIVGGVALRSLADAVKHTLDFVETEQEGTRKRGNPGHRQSPCTATLRGPDGAPTAKRNIRPTACNMATPAER